jgi:predicted aspartyl protease
MTPFNPQHGLIVIYVTLFNADKNRTVRLALDTGASSTLVSKEVLIALGYDLDVLPKTASFTTGSQVESAPRVTVDRVEALEQECQNLSVIAHTLPPSASIDGVLGLDFLRGYDLHINFKTGEITLT